MSFFVSEELSPTYNPNRSVVRFAEHPSSRYEDDQDQHDFTMHQLQQKNLSKGFTSSTQTCKNIAKIRWVQDNQPQVIPDPYATEHFVSGSCGEAANDISLWRLKVNEPDDYGRPSAKVDLMNRVKTTEEVTDMQIVGSEILAMTTSEGSLLAYKFTQDNEGDFASIQKWTNINKLHNIKNSSVPATGLATNDSFIITVGEDGSIVESSVDSFKVVRRLETVDPLSIYSVCLIGRSEILTGNGGGQLKLWDIRSADTTPMQIMNPNNNLYGAVSIAQHPSQSHLIVVGYHSGSMDLWDLRMGSGCDPIANLSADGGSLSEIYFHKVNPDHFFTCAQSGQVRHWYPTDKEPELLQGSMDFTQDLNIEFLKRGLVFNEMYLSPFPINSISLSKNDRLICGGDSGVIFCTETSTN